MTSSIERLACILITLVLVGGAAGQYQVSGSRHIEVGRQEDGSIPQIPDQIMSQIPMGCMSTWNNKPSGASLASPVVSRIPRDNRSPQKTERPGSQASMHARYAAHGDHSSQPSMTPELRLRRQIEDAHRIAQNQSDPLGDLLGGGGDPLGNLGPAKKRGRGKSAAESKAKKLPDPHEALWADNCYPSAATCAKCHPKHYEEWRASSHAYSSVSPMFQVFEQTISKLSMGTVGYFCLRCHAPVATQMSTVERSTTLLDAPVVIREGITCIACHRVNERYGKTNGHRRIELGNIHAPVYGGGDGSGVIEAIAQKDKYKVKLSPADKGPGQPIHLEARFFEPLTKSEFCMPCHQVAVHPGIALEVVWNQYRNAPARYNNVSCQDCHMGHTPGKANGYACGHIAELGGKPYGYPKKMSNHNFWGPNYSIAHPGLFPHNPKADRWSPRAWLSFDWRAGWGTDAFEKSLSASGANGCFPHPWEDADDRRDARKIINANIKRANEKRQTGIQTLAGALVLDGPHIDSTPRVGAPLKFKIRVINNSDGHNFPTASLGAQPQQWLNVSVINPFGQIIWESGYLDSNGDLAELMSEDVMKKRIKPDLQLFNLQTKFLITNVKGPDREWPLPVNVDIDQIPFLRPGNVPFSVLNHPPFIRMEAHSIPPMGHKDACYKVPAECMTQPGTYRISVRFRARLEPPYFMRFCNSTPEMIRRMNEQIMDINPQTTEIYVR